MATLDTNNKGATAAEITLTTETVFTFYIFSESGSEGEYRVSLEVSPDSGTTWIPAGATLARPGISTCQCVATKARVKVVEAQGATSTVNVFLLAR